MTPNEYDREFVRTLLALSKTNEKDKAYTICHHFSKLGKQNIVQNLILEDESI